MTTLTPKLVLGLAVPPDETRLTADLVSELQNGAFRVHTSSYALSPAVTGTRGPCRLIVRNGENSAQLGDVFRLQARGFGPLMFGYRGRWVLDGSNDFRAFVDGFMSGVEGFSQRHLAQLNIRRSRPAVLALAQSGSCRGTQLLLNEARVWPLPASAN